MLGRSAAPKMEIPPESVTRHCGSSVAACSEPWAFMRRFVLAVLACAACLWASTDPRAMTEANTGLALARQKKYELAIPHYRAAIALDPHLPGIYLNLGLAYFKLDRLPEAASALEQDRKSTRLNSSHVRISYAV